MPPDVCRLRDSTLGSLCSSALAGWESEDFGWHLPVPLAEIRPTQMAVGMRAVEAKRRKIERLSESTRKLRRFLEKRRIPAVIGPAKTTTSSTIII